MTDNHYYYQEFISAIRKKIPHKSTLVNTITDLLDIDKDAVYRRLRGTVQFSFIEMAIIAKKLGVSLDSIAEIETLQTKTAQMDFTRHINPSEVDYKMFTDFLNMLKFIKDEPETTLLESGNLLPYYLFYDYEYLTRYNIFRWCQASSYGDKRPFHEITIPERLRELQKRYCMYSRHIKSTQYVWDAMIFQQLVNNIKFFAKVRFIKEEDVCLIKNDLLKFLNDVENLAIKGKHEETRNEVSIFISELNFDTNYSCLKNNDLQLTIFKTFILNSIASLNEEVFKETSFWIRSLQRTSTLISAGNEKNRALFFEKQREIIYSL